MKGVMISACHDDAPGHTGRLHDALRTSFPDVPILLDASKVEIGEDFVAAIERAVHLCDLALVVIGRNFLASADGGNLATREIGAALEKGLRVIPVLVDGGRMPTTNDLPAEIQRLARHQAAELRDIGWDSDVKILISLLGKPRPVATRRDWRYFLRLLVHWKVIVAFVTIVSIVCIAVLSAFLGDSNERAARVKPTMTLKPPVRAERNAITSTWRYLALLPSKKLAFLSEDQGVILWDLRTGESEQVFATKDQGGPYALLGLPDSRLALIYCHQLEVWDTTTRKTETILKRNPPPSDVCNINLGFFRLSDGLVYDNYWVWDLKSKGGKRSPYSEVFFGEGSILLLDGRIAFVERGLKIWNRGAEKIEMALQGDFVTLAQLRDGRIVARHSDGIARIWNLETGTAKVLVSKESKSDLEAVVVLPNQEILIIREDQIETWQSNGDRPEIVSPGLGRRMMREPSLLSDGRLAMPFDDGTIRLWNTKTRKVDMILELPMVATQWAMRKAMFTYSATGILATAYEDLGSIFVWDLNQQQLGRN